MSIAGYIIAGLAVAIVAILAVGATILNIERKLTQQAKETAENEKRKADIITATERIKQNANTGNHTNDMHTMADQLHNYANAGK